MTSQAITHIDVTWPMNGNYAHAKFDILPGVTALIGPSGAGKTSLARIICGLEQQASGTIQILSKELLNTHANICIATTERNIGLVMQEPGLFPTMSVRKNIELASQINKADLQQLLEITSTQHLLDRSPDTLSGGEARRIAIVRAMAAKPDLLILDEPMNGLDPMVRHKIMTLIRKLAHNTGTPVLLITHQLEEMLFAADHALLIESGTILSAGAVESVLAAPETTQLLGIDDAGSLFTATVTQNDDGLLLADLNGDHLHIADDGEPSGAKLRLRILARDVALSQQKLEGISVLNQLQAEIIAIEHGAKDALVTLRLINSEHQLQSRITKKSCNAMQLHTGSTVFCLIKAVAVKELVSDTQIASSAD